MSVISDGAIVTLLYAMAGGSGDVGTIGEEERSVPQIAWHRDATHGAARGPQASRTS